MHNLKDKAMNLDNFTIRSQEAVQQAFIIARDSNIRPWKQDIFLRLLLQE